MHISCNLAPNSPYMQKTLPLTADQCMKKILVIVGTRPNFIKISRFKALALHHAFDLRIVHTGQHFDEKMADVFFRDLQIQPDYLLEVPSVSPEQQMMLMQAKLSKLIATTFKPDLVMVVGDVNSTRAGAEAAQIHNIPIAHIESGLRSFDQSMPEEINRIVADNLATYFFITEQSGIDNLTQEGKPDTHQYLVGNTMIDTLVHFDEQIRQNPIMSELQLTANQFILMTMHRPSNVDTREGLESLIATLLYLCTQAPVVFPMHPRTKQKMVEYDLWEKCNNIPQLISIEPLDYFAFQNLIAHCLCIVTDSGGIQEEATFRLKPCLTLRPNTERPITLTTGTNTLITEGLPELKLHIEAIQSRKYKTGNIPPLWDGKASERIFEIIAGLN